MKYFIDTEFEENGTTIIPVSLGIKAEDGRELYLINREYMSTYYNLESYQWRGIQSEPSSWLHNNVLQLISKEDTEKFGVPYEKWGSIIQTFISKNGKYKSRNEIELWGWYSAYDHVLLAQIYGPMINLPEPIPMFTNDLETIRNEQEVLERDLNKFPEHNALSDAKYQEDLYWHWTDGFRLKISWKNRGKYEKDKRFDS